MRVLLVGLGGIGQRHLRNLQTKFGDRLEVLAYRKQGHKEEIGNDLHVNIKSNIENIYNISTFNSLDDALKEGPYATFICNPSSKHIEPAIKAAEAGSHIFIEKPLSNSMRGVEELIKLCNNKELTACIGFQLRFNPTVKLLKEKIESGYMGDIISVQSEVGSYMPAWFNTRDYRQIYVAKADLGGGVILTQSHELDYLYWFFGMPSRVYALGGKLSDLDINTEDSVDALLQIYNNGRNIPVSVHMDFLQKPQSRTCKIVGTKGKIKMDLSTNCLVTQKLDGSEEKYEFNNYDRNQMFVDELNQFFDCAENSIKPLVGLEDGLNSLKIAIAIKDSIDKKTEVCL